jgi:hypothetical protein
MDTLSSIENGQIVCESPIAPHEKAPLRMSFNYSPSKSYFLWYRVGGGGGHQLLIDNLIVHTVIFDHADKLLLRNYDALKSQNGVQIKAGFYLNLLRATARSLLAQLEDGQDADSHLVNVFESSGMHVTLASMKAMEELATALISMQGQEQALSLLQPPRRVSGGRVRLAHEPRFDDMMDTDTPLGLLLRAHLRVQRTHPVEMMDMDAIEEFDY